MGSIDDVINYIIWRSLESK